MRISPLVLVLFALISFSSLSYAQKKIVVRTTISKVYDKPTTKSDVLFTLKKGDDVKVLGINKAGWAKVKVTVQENFSFTGWVFKSSLEMKNANKQEETAVTSKKKVSDLEKFFEPVPTPQKTSSARLTKSRKKPSRKKHKTTSRTKRERKIKELTWLNPYLNASWTVHGYEVSQASGQVFTYSLSGLSFRGGILLKAPSFFNDFLYPSLELDLVMGFLSTSTNLRDGTGNQFGSIKAKNKIFGYNAKANFLFNVQENVNGKILVGPTLGYSMLKFKADDIVDDNDTRSGLYVSNKRSSITAGLRADVTTFAPFHMVAGVDLGLKNNVSEEPDGFTGENPEAKMLYAPYISLYLPVKKPNHILGLDYRLQYQVSNYEGDSTQERAGQVVTDASITQFYHFVGLTYLYQF